MADREAFLNRIRQRRQRAVHFPAHDPGPDVPMSVLADDTPLVEMLNHFVRMLEEAGGHAIRVPHDQAACEWLLDFVAQRGIQRVVFSRDVPVQGIPARFIDAGVTVTVAPGREATSSGAGEAFRRACIEADLGVTGAAFALADTGTLVILARPGVPRITSLLPPVHIAVLRPTHFLPNMPTLIRRLRSEIWPQDGLPGTMSFITGPSRTGDIEQTLSVGVHGPGEVFVVIVESPERDG